MNTLYFSKEFSQELMYPEMQADIKFNIINVSTSCLWSADFQGCKLTQPRPFSPVMRIEYLIMALFVFSVCDFSISHIKRAGVFILCSERPEYLIPVFFTEYRMSPPWKQPNETQSNSKKRKNIQSISYVFAITIHIGTLNETNQYQLKKKKKHWSHFLFCTFPFF